jgi:nicotinate-nucleotide pyrophosphorylase (carboxylating)
MSTEEMKTARARIPAFMEVEASGNMTLERVSEVAAIGVDYISVGKLTHSAPCADFSLLFEWPAAGEEK